MNYEKLIVALEYTFSVEEQKRKEALEYFNLFSTTGNFATALLKASTDVNQ